MLHDLIVDQEVGDLIIDLSDSVEIAESVQEVLERATATASAHGAHLVVRAPAQPPQPLLDAAADVPTFVAVDGLQEPDVD